MTKRAKFIGVFATVMISLVIILLAHGMASIADMEVDVAVSTGPSSFDIVPYLSATNKPVTEVEVQQIKKAIPAIRVVAGFYHPDHLIIYSDMKVKAEFWRRIDLLDISLVKTDGIWRAEKIFRQRNEALPPPISFWDRFLNKVSRMLPF
jgi:hypothetical protein